MLARLVFVVLLFSLLAPTLRAAEPIRVVVSIAPLHSLVTSVMAGVAEPTLLVRGVSPHTFIMKPSQMRALHQADLVVWTGISVESFLPKTLDGLKKSTQIIEILAEPTVQRLAARQGGRWLNHDHHAHSHADDRGMDGHVWLDPQNAQAITAILVEHLVMIDPHNEALYRENGRNLIQRLQGLDRRLMNDFADIKQQPFVVFHDAYHYLESRYDLNAIGALSISPERRPSAGRLRDIRQLIKQQGAVCVFSEPQFSAALINSVIEGLHVNVAELDPMGLGIAVGTEMYFDLMKKMATNLRQCLN